MLAWHVTVDCQASYVLGTSTSATVTVSENGETVFSGYDSMRHGVYSASRAFDSLPRIGGGDIISAEGRAYADSASATIGAYAHTSGKGVLIDPGSSTAVYAASISNLTVRYRVVSDMIPVGTPVDLVAELLFHGTMDMKYYPVNGFLGIYDTVKAYAPDDTLVAQHQGGASYSSTWGASVNGGWTYGAARDPNLDFDVSYIGQLQFSGIVGDQFVFSMDLSTNLQEGSYAYRKIIEGDIQGSYELFATDPDTGLIMDSVFLEPQPVPIPAAAWFFASGLACLSGIRRRSRKRL